MSSESNPKLTPKQRAFCDYYIESGNAYQSAVKAGYSKHSASAIATENLNKPYMRAYIDKRMEEIQNDKIASAAEVLQYLTSVVRDEETEEVVVTENIGDYQSEAKVIDKKLLAKDKIKAAELLGKRYRLFADRMEADVNHFVSFEGENNLED